jgi:hypothetical protein
MPFESGGFHAPFAIQAESVFQKSVPSPVALGVPE